MAYQIDLGAEGLVGATKEGQKIAVEIKSFIARSIVNEFHRMVGQFNDYYVALQMNEPDRELYVAIPETIFISFFQKQIIQKSLERIEAKLIVYDPIEKTIIQWIN